MPRRPMTCTPLDCATRLGRICPQLPPEVCRLGPDGRQAVPAALREYLCLGFPVDVGQPGSGVNDVHIENVTKIRRPVETQAICWS